VNIELKLPGTEGRVWCEKEVTFESRELIAPTSKVELKPTFPTSCKATIGTDHSEKVTVESCSSMKILSYGSISFESECKFKMTLEEHKMCSLTMGVQSYVPAVKYSVEGSIRDIKATIKDHAVSYTVEKCGIGNGNKGEFTAKLLLKGFEKGSAVGVEIK
jgi:hypothetical protein